MNKLHTIKALDGEVSIEIHNLPCFPYELKDGEFYSNFKVFEGNKEKLLEIMEFLHSIREQNKRNDYIRDESKKSKNFFENVKEYLILLDYHSYKIEHVEDISPFMHVFQLFVLQNFDSRTQKYMISYYYSFPGNDKKHSESHYFFQIFLDEYLKEHIIDKIDSDYIKKNVCKIMIKLFNNIDHFVQFIKEKFGSQIIDIKLQNNFKVSIFKNIIDPISVLNISNISRVDINDFYNIIENYMKTRLYKCFKYMEFSEMRKIFYEDWKKVYPKGTKEEYDNFFR